MIRLRPLLLASLLTFGVAMMLACGGSVKKPEPSQKEADPAANANAKADKANQPGDNKPWRPPADEPKLAKNDERAFPYEVLKKESRKTDGKLMLEVLVDEKASKQDVMKLAENLRREYAGRYSTISIFDSREAARRRTDETYPEKELSRHWLVVVDWGGDTGSKEEIRWVAEGRDEQEANGKVEAQNQAAIRLADLKAKLLATQKEEEQEKQRATQARREASDATEKADQADRNYRNSQKSSSTGPAISGSAEAKARLQEFQDNLRASGEVAKAKQKAKELEEKARQAEANARQAAISVADAKAALQQARQALSGQGIDPDAALVLGEKLRQDAENEAARKKAEIEAARKMEVQRQAAAELPGMRQALKAAQDEYEQDRSQMNDAGNAYTKAKDEAARDAKLFTAASKMYDRITANSPTQKEKDAAYEQYASAKDKAIESKQRAEEVGAAASRTKSKSQLSKAKVEKAAAAVRQAEQDAQ